MNIDYIIEITTSRNVTCRYFTYGPIDIEKYIKLVMESEKCPRRSIIKVNIEQVELHCNIYIVTKLHGVNVTPSE